MDTVFGVNLNPTLEDLQRFIEEGCFPRTRDKMKLELDELNLQYYDPILIIKKTNGRMADDKLWIEIDEWFCVSKSSSKGNQYKCMENGYWYKIDYLGYEGS